MYRIYLCDDWHMISSVKYSIFQQNYSSILMVEEIEKKKKCDLNLI